MAWYDKVLEYVDTAKDYYDEYKDIINTTGKVASSAGKAYLDYKDQKRRNDLDESVYDDYMTAAKDAGKEAQAAVDLNLTPMTVTGVPTSKADVTNFTALAANGGIIGLRNGTPNPGIAALRKKAPEVVKRMGFEKGSEPNAGIAALRKKAPGVVKRMGFQDGTNPLKQIIEKIKNNQYKRQLGKTDDGDLAERTSEYVDNNPFKENITAIREPKESENRAMLNAMISDGLDTEAKMDEASKEKIILSLLEEMRRSGEMEKKEYDIYMESYSQSLNQGGIAGLRNGGRPGYMDGSRGPVGGMMGKMTDDTDGTVDVKDFITKKDDVEILNRIYSENGDEGVQAYIQENPELKDKYANIYTDYETGTVKVIPNQLYNMKSSDSGIIMLNVTENGIEPIEKKKGGRVKYAKGSDGILDLGGK